MSENITLNEQDVNTLCSVLLDEQMSRITDTLGDKAPSRRANIESFIVHLTDSETAASVARGTYKLDEKDAASSVRFEDIVNALKGFMTSAFATSPECVAVSRKMTKMLRSQTQRLMMRLGDETDDLVLRGLYMSVAATEVNLANGEGELADLDNAEAGAHAAKAALVQHLSALTSMKNSFVESIKWWRVNASHVRNGTLVDGSTATRNDVLTSLNSAKNFLDRLKLDTLSSASVKGKGKALQADEIDWTEHEDEQLARLARDVRSLAEARASLGKAPIAATAAQPEATAKVQRNQGLNAEALLEVFDSVSLTALGVAEDTGATATNWAIEYATDLAEYTLLDSHDEDKDGFKQEHHQFLNIWSKALESTLASHLDQAGNEDQTVKFIAAQEVINHHLGIWVQAGAGSKKREHSADSALVNARKMAMRKGDAAKAEATNTIDDDT